MFGRAPEGKVRSKGETGEQGGEGKRVDDEGGE